MDKLLKAILSVKELKYRTDDDFVDRLNRQYTPTILVLFAILVSVKQYVGDPITCWCPAQFTSSHQDYANTVCWVSNTYYVPMADDLPKADEPRVMISYYQWVPLILLFQALLFFVPCVIWRFLNHRSGVNLGAVVEAGQNCQNAIYPEAREKTVRYMVMQIDSYLKARRKYAKGWVSRIKQCLAKYCCIFCGRFYGNYLTWSYMLVKTLYIGNAVGQLFMLDAFLGMRNGYHMYGIHVMTKIFTGNDWSPSDRFPRVTLCDFQIRQLKNVHRHTVQCTLPINLFNEKIFIFIWFWLLCVALTTMFNLVHWIQKIAVVPMQVSYIKKQLRSMDYRKGQPKAARRFTEQFLRRDGLLLLRLVGKNAGDMIAAEVLHGLWNTYSSDRELQGEASTSHRQANIYGNYSQGGGGSGTWAAIKGLVSRPRKQPSAPEEERDDTFRVNKPEDI